NVFNQRPPSNKLEAWCYGKKLAKEEGVKLLEGYPALVKGKYITEDFRPELDRLADELEEANPNLIVALGNTAIWALLAEPKISKPRGYNQSPTPTITGFKALPTYPPAAIFQQYSLRPTVVADLMKAKREAEFPDIHRPPREIWIEPTLEDIHEF